MRLRKTNIKPGKVQRKRNLQVNKRRNLLDRAKERRDKNGDKDAK